MTTHDTTEFYITIPSWSSSKYFKQNTLGDFRIQLPLPLDLKGDWCVGLSQILYSRTWYNVEPTKNILLYSVGDRIIRITISEGCYTSEEELINQINKNVNDQGVSNKSLYFSYNSHNGKCFIRLPDNATLSLGLNIANLLGFNQYILHESHESVNPVNLHYNIKAIYLYCDLIEDQIVGGEKWQMLRFLNVQNNTFGASVMHYYDNPQYISLAKKSFETINIKICNQNKDIINFKKGVSIIQLHFKLTKIPLFY